MARLSDLSPDLVGEVISRVPITSLGAVRSTSKNWNDLSQSKIVGKGAPPATNQFLGFVLMDSKIHSMKFDLQGIDNNNDDGEFTDPLIKQVSKLAGFEICNVFHNDGILLGVIKGERNVVRLVVCNPYLGKTRMIKPRLRNKEFCRLDVYGLGYDSNRNHKLLRFLKQSSCISYHSHVTGYEIYDFNADSWRKLDVKLKPDCDIVSDQRSVSLKGNAYFVAQVEGMIDGEVVIDFFLLCFDFTTERFGPRLPLPFDQYEYDEDDDYIVALSCVREEKLAALYQYYGTLEIWVTEKIDPNAVSFSKFFMVDITPLNGFLVFPTEFRAGSFFIDEEKQVAVVFDDHDGYRLTEARPHQTAHIIGEQGYMRSVNIVKAPNLEEPGEFGRYCLPLVCTSYVPSLVSLEINKHGKRKKRDY